MAYGCAFYVKAVDPANGTVVKLVLSKTRVTIPRLELCGAHLMAKVLEEVRTVHDIEPDTICLRSGNNFEYNGHFHKFAW